MPCRLSRQELPLPPLQLVWPLSQFACRDDGQASARGTRSQQDVTPNEPAINQCGRRRQRFRQARGDRAAAASTGRALGEHWANPGPTLGQPWASTAPTVRHPRALNRSQPLSTALNRSGGLGGRCSPAAPGGLGRGAASGQPPTPRPPHPTPHVNTAPVDRAPGLARPQKPSKSSTKRSTETP